MGRSDDPQPLRHGLELFLKHLGAPPVDVLSDLADRWEEIVGPALATATRPVELIDGVLVVGCDDPAWAAQIGWMEAQITQRFGEVFPDVVVSRVTARTLR
ncbi:MAG: DUF721 domain-containing protein [Acidimicrobiia bacterium]|nr:DUF721 domain-containing protein [Acidimicrobiia bacterium]